MEFTQPDFTKFFTFNQPIWGQVESFNQMAMKSMHDITEIQSSTVKTLLDFGTESITVPASANVGDFVTEQVKRTVKLTQTLGENALEIFKVAETAREDAFATATSETS